MTSYALLLAGLLWVGLGLGYRYRPQAMFRVRSAPFAADGDGLTASGEESYRRLGLFHLLMGVGLTLISLTG